MADRIEKEIEEILRKIDDFVPEKPRSVRKRPADKSAPAFENPSRSATPRPGAGGSLSRVSLNQVMGWSLIAVLVAFFLPIPGSGWVILAALLVFGVAFLLSRMGSVGGGGSRGAEKRWRGEPIDLSGPSLPTRLRDWIKGKRRR